MSGQGVCPTSSKIGSLGQSGQPSYESAGRVCGSSSTCNLLATLWSVTSGERQEGGRREAGSVPSRCSRLALEGRRATD
jgi:hypothetical protein